MQCLNPLCKSTDASEINISVNTSDMDGTDYTGDTDYGSPSDAIGTWCRSCLGWILLPNARAIMLKFLLGEDE